MLKKTKQAQMRSRKMRSKPLNTMQQTLPLMMDQQRFEEIAAQQRDLAERLTALREDNKNDPANMRRIAEWRHSNSN